MGLRKMLFGGKWYRPNTGKEIMIGLAMFQRGRWLVGFGRELAKNGGVFQVYQV